MSSNICPRMIDPAAARTLIGPLTDVVTQAGRAILEVKRTSMRVEGKADGSPVTDADHAADRIIAEGLGRAAPGLPVLSEERTDLATRPYADSFFLVDPLDGTKEFIAGRDEFTVNIALITHGRPVLGVIAAPALGLIWRGIPGHGAERLAIMSDGKTGPSEPIRTRPHPLPGQPWIVAVSRSHGDPRTEAFIANRPGAVRLALGSAIKFGRIAEGNADIYPRLSPTSEWDVAAGQAVVVAAGGQVTDGAGREMRFGQMREDFLVPDFIVWGDPKTAEMPR
ncbi:MAG: 3'(2'),5'-bisphosphate nucleotidase [Bradyrhizobiaceae bacterium]|nr:MAG: 3'(2'),5'-bisphosphate nucleotidase [Bradyrhizobiaceae bacterium]